MAGQGQDDRARIEDFLVALEVQADAEEALDDDLATEEVIRAEHARIGWAERLRACGVAGVELPDGSWVSGRVVRVFSDGVLIDQGPQGSEGDTVVRAAALTAITGLGVATRAAQPIEDRLGLGAHLRGWSSRGLRVRCRRPNGDIDGELLRVGADHLDLRLLRPGGDPHSPAEVVSVPFAALWCVHLR